MYYLQKNNPLNLALRQSIKDTLTESLKQTPFGCIYTDYRVETKIGDSTLVLRYNIIRLEDDGNITFVGTITQNEETRPTSCSFEEMVATNAIVNILDCIVGAL
jgi:hypothetical protein